MKFSQGFQVEANSSMSLSYGVKKRAIEELDEHQLQVERKKIKNRASAAKSRERKAERLKYLEEQVEELREENTQMKKLIKLMEIEHEEEKAQVFIENKHRRTCSC
ncbi:hypothetical protein M5689_022666 [Euphorbia peplus]|nr:hypothetical protein M5689_022666 [Euphorbia peplus]